jgi:telomerase Cajal body protein 1
MQTLDAHGTCVQLAANRDQASAPTAAAPNSNFWRQCCWSPDGTCILAAQDDDIVQVFAAPQLRRRLPDADDDGSPAVSTCELDLALTVPQSESLYACEWYPAFRAEDAQTACFAASCRGQPVHLWDAFLGTQRCTYRTYDQMDEVATAHSLRFHPDGERCEAIFILHAGKCA